MLIDLLICFSTKVAFEHMIICEICDWLRLDNRLACSLLYPKPDDVKANKGVSSTENGTVTTVAPTHSANSTNTTSVPAITTGKWHTLTKG